MPRFTVTVSTELHKALISFARENGIRPATAAAMLLRRALNNYLPDADHPATDHPATDNPAETDTPREQTTP